MGKNLEASIRAEIDAHREEICQLSLAIHDSPELGFREIKAVEWLSNYLEKNGFSIERGVYTLETAFRASYGNGKPVIAFLAEYDALPEIGHACGHNIIAAIAVGAATGCKLAVDKLGGTIEVIGTPAEELYGGKMIMAEKGAFNNLDAAMMVHPGTHDSGTTEALACQGLKVEFYGKAAHAASRPELGINALEAMIQSFVNINSLRQHIQSKARIHGIITNGGQAANIVPAYTSGIFLVRASDDKYLEELKEKVINCFTAAAIATSARLEYTWDKSYYATMVNNITIAELFVKNAKSLGRDIQLVDPDKSFGSTDFGNVSHIVPAVHASVAIAPPGTVVHSPEFAVASCSQQAMQGLIDAAKSLALTATDLFSNQGLLNRAWDEFRRE